MHFKEIMDFTSKVIDAAGVAVIVIGALYATITFMRNIFHRKHGPADPYRDYRETVARSILLGLEFLIAGDIILAKKTALCKRPARFPGVARPALPFLGHFRVNRFIPSGPAKHP